MWGAEKRRGEGRGGAEPVQGLTGQQREGGCVHWGSALDRGGRGDVLMGGGPQHQPGRRGWSQGARREWRMRPRDRQWVRVTAGLAGHCQDLDFFSREREPHGRVLRGDVACVCWGRSSCGLLFWGPKGKGGDYSDAS